jgi:hypothetical protein
MMMRRMMQMRRRVLKVCTFIPNFVSNIDCVADTRPGPVVIRPPLSKFKKRSSLRLSFRPGDDPATGNNERNYTASKKSSLSRLAIEQYAQVRGREDRPSYSEDYIAELRNSTPSRPIYQQSTPEEIDAATMELDIAAKFGPQATLTVEKPSIIPTEAEIQEKKARRARLAKEQQAFISLGGGEKDDWASDDDDDEFRSNRNEISLRPKQSEKYPESRLVPDDEDFAEGFDEYVEDGRIALGQKAEREAQKKKRAEMAELIAEAEQGSGDDASNDSEAERNTAYEVAQTRAGAYGQRDRATKHGDRTPSRISPLPDLNQVFVQLQNELKAKEAKKENFLKSMEELRLEKIRITERQKYVQEQLRETGEKYEKLREQAGMAHVPLNGTGGGKLIVNRGLDSLGATPTTVEGNGTSDEEAV